MDAERGRRHGPLQRRRGTSPASPPASVPAGFGADGLPRAVQIVGRPDDEGTLLSLAAQIEAERPWAQQPPARVRVSDGRASAARALAASSAARAMAGALLLERVSAGRERAGERARARPPTWSARPISPPSARSASCSPRGGPTTGSSARRAGARQGTSGLSWVVDPLDGTVNFLFGIPQWCVSVAVRDERGTRGGRGLRPQPRRAVHRHARGRPRLIGPAARSSCGRRARDGRDDRRVRPGSGRARRAGEGDGRPRASPTTRSVRAAQARGARAPAPARARHPPLRQRRAGPRVDGGRALRRLLRAHGQAVGHRRRRADLRTRPGSGARAARARAPALGHPRGPPGAGRELLELVAAPG